MKFGLQKLKPFFNIKQFIGSGVNLTPASSRRVNTEVNTDYIVSSCWWLTFYVFLEKVLTLVLSFFLSERWTQPLLTVLTIDGCVVWFPPFRCSFAASPFRCAVVLCHCTVAVLPFCSYRCRCRWEWKCWKHLSVYIGWSDQNADWLSTNGRMAKNRIRCNCYGTAVIAQWQV